MPLITSELSYSDDYPTIEPSLKLDFANARALDPRITFTRASVGTYVGANGLIKTAGEDVPRFDHDPTTGESLGLLIEESRTNQWGYSNDFSQSKYNYTGVNVNQNVLAPDGTNTAWSIADTAVESRHNLDALGVSGCQSGVGDLTTSVYVKPISGTKLITIYTKGSGNVGRGQLQFNPVTKAVTLQNGTSVGDAIDAGNGWYRLWFTRNYPTNEGNINVRISFNAYSIYTGGNDEFYIWGLVQENGGTFPTSYIPTSGASATRAVDNAFITGQSFSSFYNQTEGTWLCNFDYKGNNTSGSSTLYSTALDQSDRNWLRINYTTGTPNTIRQAINSDTDDSEITVNSNTLNKISQAYASGDQSVYINGSVAIESTRGISTNHATLDIGNIVWSKGLNQTIITGYINKLSYYPKRLTNAQLQTLTQ